MERDPLPLLHLLPLLCLSPVGEDPRDVPTFHAEFPCTRSSPSIHPSRIPPASWGCGSPVWRGAGLTSGLECSIPARFPASPQMTQS